MFDPYPFPVHEMLLCGGGGGQAPVANKCSILRYLGGGRRGRRGGGQAPVANKCSILYFRMNE